MIDPNNPWPALSAVVALAGLVSSIVTLAVTNWMRKRSRPEADWVVQSHASMISNDKYASHTDNEGWYQITGKLANAGDAAAFRLVLKTNVGNGYLHTPIGSQFGGATVHEWIAVLPPGQSTDFRCVFPPEHWGAFTLTLDWITSPTRRKKHLQFDWKPSDDSPVPKPMRMNPKTGVYEAIEETDAQQPG